MSTPQQILDDEIKELCKKINPAYDPRVDLDTQIRSAVQYGSHSSIVHKKEIILAVEELESKLDCRRLIMDAERFHLTTNALRKKLKHRQLIGCIIF
jgi:hypothetical protein